jgi:hypothetical protein
VQNILENARQCRHRNHRQPIVLQKAIAGGHGVSYNILPAKGDASAALKWVLLGTGLL